MTTIKNLYKKTRSSHFGQWLNILVRFFRALPVAARPIGYLITWTFSSREDTNFTYPLKPLNEQYLAHTVAIVTGGKWEEARKYIDEAKTDKELAEHIISHISAGPDRSYSDRRADFGKRLGWYAVVRILKPELVVETGVDKGLGTVMLASAIRRNGHGRIVGTDINPAAGALLAPPYDTVSEIMYGDSIKSLKSLRNVDIFINDSDHSSEYEKLEYETIERRLGKNAVLIADNAHVTPELMKWAEKNGWNYLFWKEEPENHWYPGAGIGFAFRPMGK